MQANSTRMLPRSLNQCKFKEKGHDYTNGK